MRHRLFLVVACLLMAGCVDDLSGDVYSREDARKTMDITYGTVVDVRPVVIEGERGFLGQGGGAVIGGMAGNSVGSGSGNHLATAAGAVAGAVIGSAVQERATRAQGAEIAVRLDSDGTTIAVVQQVEDPNEFVAGQRIRLVRGNGNARVAALGTQSSP